MVFDWLSQTWLRLHDATHGLPSYSLPTSMHRLHTDDCFLLFTQDPNIIVTVMYRNLQKAPRVSPSHERYARLLKGVLYKQNGRHFSSILLDEEKHSPSVAKSHEAAPCHFSIGKLEFQSVYQYVTVLQYTILACFLNTALACSR